MPKRQQRTWVFLSRSVKYQCPLDQTLHWTTSPRTQSGIGWPSSRRLTDALSWETDQTSSVVLGMVSGREAVIGPDRRVASTSRKTNRAWSAALLVKCSAAAWQSSSVLRHPV